MFEVTGDKYVSHFTSHDLLLMKGGQRCPPYGQLHPARRGL